MKTIKSSLQSLLSKLGIYYRFKQSFMYDLFWGVADSRHIRERDAEVRFYRSLLSGLKPGALIFDVGANCGHKTDVFLRIGARVVSVDPDETNQTILRQRFHHFRLMKKPVSVVGKAVSATVREETMWIDQPGSAKNTLSTKWVDTLRATDSRFGKNLDFKNKRTVTTTTLDQLISEYGSPYFIKIDVEGYEAEVLSGLTKSVPILSFEVNLPEFLAEGIQCVEILAKLNKGGRFNYLVDCDGGLLSKEWLPADEFLGILKACRAPSIEILWRSK